MGSTAEFDWRPRDWLESGHFAIEVVVENGRFFQELELGGTEGLPITSQVAEVVSNEAGEARVHVTGVDPYVGAGGYGLGVLVQFLDVGADLITWGVAAAALAPRIRRVLEGIASRLSPREGTKFSLSAPAMAVLVTADVCEHHGVAAEAISRVQFLSHEINPPESRTEIARIYSTYTVAVEYQTEWEGLDVRTYTVTPYGKILHEAAHRVPIPNGGHWEFPEPLSGRVLKGLERHGA